MRFGAVDVGTNSIHLIVVEIDPYVGSTKTVLKAREMVRLGAGDSLIRERLAKKAITRAVEVISQFVEEAYRAGASAVRVAATSAVRDAKNRSELQDAVLARTGITVDVLSGREEARLIHLGVSRGYRFEDGLTCIVDIGGGSTEFIVADQRRTYLLKSLPLGSLRLYESFRAGDVLDTSRLEAHLQATLKPLTDAIESGESLPDGAAIKTVVGTSGTWLGLAALDAADRGVHFNRSHGATLELERLIALQAQMLTMTIEERRRMPGMSPRRSDIIIAGNAVAIAALTTLGLTKAVVCDRALREGIVADFLQKNHDRIKSIGDQRLRRLDSIRDIVRRFSAETMHESHVAQLAMELYDSFATTEPWDDSDRDLLVAAAIVHDVGRSIHSSSHHKHSAYIVRHANLVGWRPAERELLAQIVRYHRKTLPKTTHPEFMLLEASLRRRVERIAAFLRIADGLDARHLSRVLGARFIFAAGKPIVELRAEGEVTAEVQAAQGKADLFARVYGVMPEFRVVAAVGERAQGEPVGAA